jgi:hypothetical protein
MVSTTTIQPQLVGIDLSWDQLLALSFTWIDVRNGIIVQRKANNRCTKETLHERCYFELENRKIGDSDDKKWRGAPLVGEESFINLQS